MYAHPVSVSNYGLTGWQSRYLHATASIQEACGESPDMEADVSFPHPLCAAAHVRGYSSAKNHVMHREKMGEKAYLIPRDRSNNV